MPLSYPAAVTSRIGKSGEFGWCWLIDVLTADGTYYYMSNMEGAFPKKITAAPGNSAYYVWVKSVTGLKLSRDSRTDGADLTLQNISGNTVERDVWKAIKDHEFEGALCVARLWMTLEDFALREFHCTLSETDSNEEEAFFRLRALNDPNAYVANPLTYAETCQWRFKSAQCGSAGAAAVCNKTFANCIDASRAAPERFSGVPYSPPTTIYSNA